MVENLKKQTQTMKKTNTCCRGIEIDDRAKVFSLKMAENQLLWKEICHKCALVNFAIVFHLKILPLFKFHNFTMSGVNFQ